MLVTNSEHIATAKSKLRQSILAAVRAQSSVSIQQKAEFFAKALLPILMARPGVWGGYRPMKDEPQIDLVALLGYAQAAFPVTQGLSLIFQRLVTQWKRSPMGFDYPFDGEAIDLGQMSGIIIPCVGVSPRGARLGRGAGFYDRALAEQTLTREILKIGLCYECGYKSEIPQESHDLVLDLVVTESRVILFNLKYETFLKQVGISYQLAESYPTAEQVEK